MSRKFLLRAWPEDGTIAPGLLDKVEQVIVGFLLKAGEDLPAQPTVVGQVQVLGTDDVMPGGSHESPVVWRAVGQIPHDIIVVGEIDSAFFSDACPGQIP